MQERSVPKQSVVRTCSMHWHPSGAAACRTSISLLEKAGLTTRPRKQKEVRAELISELRKTRKSARISQLLESISPRTKKEYTMGITAYGRVPDWKRALSLLDEMSERGVAPDVISLNAAISA